MQIAAKARYRHVMYLDEHGARFSSKMMLPQSVAMEAGLLGLTGAYCLDTELVRSSATGGSKIYAVNHEGDSAPLSYVSLTDSRTIATVCDRIQKKTTYGPWIGRLVPVMSSPGTQSAVPVDAQLIMDMFRTFFLAGQSEQTVRDCAFAEPELQSVWQAFVDGGRKPCPSTSARRQPNLT